MTIVVHVLKPGETCDDPMCQARSEHYTPPPKPVVTLYGTTWQTREGEVLDVSEMHPRHALNTWCLLHRKAWGLAMREIHSVWSSPFAPMGDMATDSVERMHDEMMRAPHAWLNEEPLMAALWERAMDGFPHEPRGDERRVRGPIAVLDDYTTDGRRLESNGYRPPTTPFPVLHRNELVGRIEHVELVGDVLWAYGFADVQKRTHVGVDVDGDDAHGRFIAWAVKAVTLHDDVRELWPEQPVYLEPI